MSVCTGARLLDDAAVDQTMRHMEYGRFAQPA